MGDGSWELRICRGGFAAHRTGGSLPFVCDKTMLIIITKFQKRQTNPPTPPEILI
jgi:hypothetical protein